MSWNYRLVRWVPDGALEPVVELREVFYNEGGVPYCHEVAYIFSETESGAREMISKAAEGAAKPVIDWITPTRQE